MTVKLFIYGVRNVQGESMAFKSNAIKNIYKQKTLNELRTQ